MTEPTPSRLRRAYLSTEIVVDVDGSTLSAGDAAAALGPFFVLTAWNPSSKRLADRENARRNRELREALEARGVRLHPATGRSPDGAWEEPGFAVVGLGRRTARSLGREFGQHAIFEVSPPNLSVIGCSSRWTESRLLDDAHDTGNPRCGDDLGTAVQRTLGVVVECDLVRAQLPGWSHEPGVGLACLHCGEALELFGAELTARDGTPYRSMFFVCPHEARVFRPHDVPDAYRETVKAWRDYLLARGDADRFEPDAPRRWVYCIELDEQAGERPDERPWIYVGQTAKTPEERFEQHRAGTKASRWVRGHGVRLRPDLYGDQPVLRSGPEALAYERWRFESLRAAGWPVKGGH